MITMPNHLLEPDMNKIRKLIAESSDFLDVLNGLPFGFHRESVREQEIRLYPSFVRMAIAVNLVRMPAVSFQGWTDDVSLDVKEVIDVFDEIAEEWGWVPLTKAGRAALDLYEQLVNKFRDDIEMPLYESAISIKNAIIPECKDWDKISQYREVLETAQEGERKGYRATMAPMDAIDVFFEFKRKAQQTPCLGNSDLSIYPEWTWKLAGPIGRLRVAVQEAERQDARSVALEIRSKSTSPPGMMPTVPPPAPPAEEAEPPPVPDNEDPSNVGAAGFPCSKAELLRAQTKHASHTSYLDQQVQAGMLKLEKADKPVGHHRYIARFTDPKKHAEILEIIQQERTSPTRKH